METTVNQRLGKFLKNQGINQGEFAEAVGTSRTSASAIISGRRQLSQGMLARILEKYPTLNKDWLTNGVGVMLNPGNNKELRPHYPASVSAGFLGGLSDAIFEKDVEMRPVIPGIKAYDFTVDVSGESMTPTFLDKDIIACRKLESWNEIEPWKQYVIDTRNGAVVKTIKSMTLGSILCKSDNPDYPQDIRIDGLDVFGIAEVVGSIHTDMDALAKQKKVNAENMKEALMNLVSHILVEARPKGEPEDYSKLIDSIINNNYYNNNER